MAKEKEILRLRSLGMSQKAIMSVVHCASRKIKSTYEKADELSITYELIKDNPKFSYSQIAAILKLSKKTVSRNIANLRKKGLIRFEGNPRNGKWKVLKEYPNE